MSSPRFEHENLTSLCKHAHIRLAMPAVRKPSQYRRAMKSLVGTHLRTSHVVVSASLEHLIAESIAGLGWVRTRSTIEGNFEELTVAWNSEVSSAMDMQSNSAEVNSENLMESLGLSISRTFISVSRMHATDHVTRSTTDANSTHGSNPQRLTFVPSSSIASSLVTDAI